MKGERAKGSRREQKDGRGRREQADMWRGGMRGKLVAADVGARVAVMCVCRETAGNGNPGGKAQKRHQ